MNNIANNNAFASPQNPVLNRPVQFQPAQYMVRPTGVVYADPRINTGLAYTQPTPAIAYAAVAAPAVPAASPRLAGRNAKKEKKSYDFHKRLWTAANMEEKRELLELRERIYGRVAREKKEKYRRISAQNKTPEPAQQQAAENFCVIM